MDALKSHYQNREGYFGKARTPSDTKTRKLKCDDPDGAAKDFYDMAAKGGIGIKVDGEPYEIRNELQSLPYFGVAEDIGVMSVRACEPGDVKSHLVGQKLAVSKLGRLIDDVLLYEDTHALARGGVDVGSYSFTAAIVFQLEGTEIVFEKGIPF